jgi:hypothetical protein
VKESRTREFSPPARPKVRAIHTRKTKPYFEREDTVGAYREVVLGGQKLHRHWMPLCRRDGVAYTKPELVEGRDFWPDWDRLVSKARKMLRDAARDPSRRRPKAEPFPILDGRAAFLIGDGTPSGDQITKKILISDIEGAGPKPERIPHAVLTVEDAAIDESAKRRKGSTDA